MFARTTFFVCLLLAATSVAQAKTNKYAVVIGNNLGHDKENELRYAQSDAQKLYEVLVDIGGFDTARSALLLSKKADVVWKRIKKLEKQIKKDAALGNKTLLLFYYSGHAQGDTLELGSTSLSFTQIRSFLEDSKASVRLAFLDSCRSGQIIANRGGQRGPGFDIRVADEISSSGYAIITSSAHDEVSQETAELRGGFFTHFLVSALRGAADETGDGKITLDEAYRFAYRRTTARTSTTVGGGQHPMYQFQLEGRGDIVLTTTSAARSYLAVQNLKPGRLILLDSTGEALVAETEIATSTHAQLAVQPGRYQVYYVGNKGRVYGTKTKTVAGQKVTLDAEDFKPQELRTTVAKGGLFASGDPKLSHRIGVGGVWRLFPLDGETSTYGAGLGYRIKTRSGFEPAIAASWTTRSDTGVSTDYNDFSIKAGLGYLWQFSHFGVRTQALLGGDFISQSPYQGEQRYTTGFSYMALVGFEVPMGSKLYAAVDGGAGGRLFEVVDKGLVHRLDLGVTLSMGWKIHTY